MKIGILADDLTSAADAALPFMQKGAECAVLLDSNKSSDAEVLSIDCDSRSHDEESAILSVRKVAAKMAKRDVILKTLDSTLRGHVYAELSAVFPVSGRKFMVIAPAFPQAGRITLGGKQYVEGTLVSKSKYADDPVHPCTTSTISDLVDIRFGDSVVIPSDGCKVDVENALRRSKVIILDAQSQYSLDRLVSFFPDPTDILWVGSPGLAYSLSKIFKFSMRKYLTLNGKKKILIVVGSGNEVSKIQFERIECEKIILSSEIVIQYTDFDSFPDLLALSTPYEKCSSSKDLLNNIARASCEAINLGEYNCLIATGGETAKAILDLMGIDKFVLTAEIEQGFPVGIAYDNSWRNPFLISIKAGGFGCIDSLSNAIYKIDKIL